MSEWLAWEIDELDRLLAKYWPACGHLKENNVKIHSNTGRKQCWECAKEATRNWQRTHRASKKTS